MAEGPHGIHYQFFYGIIAICSTVWYFIVLKIFVVINFFKEKRVVPPVKNEILLNSAVELARKIRAREVWNFFNF